MENFVSSLNPVTKIIIVGSLIVGTLLSLKICSPYDFVLLVPDNLKNPLKYIFSVLYTPGIKMNTIMSLVFFYNTNNSLETHYLPN